MLIDGVATLWSGFPRMLVCRGACIGVRFARKVTGNSLSRRENEGRKRPAEADKRRKNVR